MKYSAILCLFLIFNINIFGEYRVYQYQVSSRSQGTITTNPYMIISTLNPRAYLAYHGGESSLELVLLRSWMCYGNTSQRETCPPPLTTTEYKDTDTQENES